MPPLFKSVHTPDVIVALEKTGIDVDEWLKRVNQPINKEKSSAKRDGNPDGHLFGEVIVFTGALKILRKEAADIAASVGCNVADGVTKKTTILVVGDTDISRLAGHNKSKKHRKAETLIEKGANLRIIRETDFKKLVSL